MFCFRIWFLSTYLLLILDDIPPCLTFQLHKLSKTSCSWSNKWEKMGLSIWLWYDEPCSYCVKVSLVRNYKKVRSDFKQEVLLSFENAQEFFLYLFIWTKSNMGFIFGIILFRCMEIASYVLPMKKFFHDKYFFTIIVEFSRTLFSTF